MHAGPRRPRQALKGAVNGCAPGLVVLDRSMGQFGAGAEPSFDGVVHAVAPAARRTGA